MQDNAAPKGLHRRMDARERNLAELEAAMAALQSEYALAAKSAGDGLAPRQLADRLAATQAAYDEALIELRGLQAMARRLRDWDLSPMDTSSWAGVCRALALPSSSGGHRAVRSAEPVLHVLLHRCALSAQCSIDGVSYLG